MMCGTPVIAYARGSMPELIIEGKTGFLVKNIAEAVVAVERLASIDPDACRQHACSKFSRDHMIEEYIGAYKIVLQG
jgi:glycosyltransferase involved in cell wall biosynthesis